MKVGFPLVAAMGSILISLAGAQVSPRGLRPHSEQLAPQPQPLTQPQPAAAPPATATSPPATATPPPPEQMPATAPQVAYSDGVLTITADNSTLGDILRAVHHQTGAAVDVPGNATERVVGRFGPGPARDVLASLLNGSHFNYVLLGSESNPTGLERVVLLSKSGDSDSPLAQARLSRPISPATPPAETADGSNDDDAAADMTPDANEANDEQANQGQADDQPQAQPPNQPAVKTPEQLLQELQQRQQQLQQQGVTPPAGYPPSPMVTTPPHQ
ncbi:MAG TPA: hypothetical protein VEK33_23335 [Terriglobales bacterium]|nr:hypothetical protein [Terriglobales bacterium]